MNIEFRCPKCQHLNREHVVDGSTGVECGACQTLLRIVGERLVDGGLQGCLVCPGRELFQRKDFSQRLGITIVLLGFVASCVTWYFHRVMMTFGILFLTALADIILYLVVGNVLECYNCHTVYRGTNADSEWSSFRLETQERFRQQQLRHAAATARSGPDRHTPMDA